MYLVDLQLGPKEMRKVKYSIVTYILSNTFLSYIWKNKLCSDIPSRLHNAVFNLKVLFPLLSKRNSHKFVCQFKQNIVYTKSSNF